MTRQIIKECLVDVHTKKLLRWLKLTRKTNGFHMLSESTTSIIGVYDYDLKDELKTREHIPNKQERKKIRIAKQKEKQNR